MSQSEDAAARLRRQQEWDEMFRQQNPMHDDELDSPWQQPMPAYPDGLDPYPQPRSRGRDPHELLREAGDPDELIRILEASYLPGRGIVTPEREAARRAEARRLRAERNTMDGLGRERARLAEEARQRALDQAMEAGFPRVTEMRPELWDG
jgi:hypothetical protein